MWDKNIATPRVTSWTDPSEVTIYLVFATFLETSPSKGQREACPGGPQHI